MKKEHDLKEVINQGLKEVSLDIELEESIKARCLGQSKSRSRHSFKYYRVVSQVAVWLIGIILIWSGTAYAMNQIEGFGNFIDETILQKIAPHVQNINKGNGTGEVKMVVESAITDHYNSLLVFSFINEGKEPWVEGTKAGYWGESWTSSSRYGPPILSEDGRKLTYYVEGYGEEDILKNKKFELKAGNLIRVSEVQEEIDIPLGELFKAHGIVLDTIDYDYESTSNGLYMKLDRMLKKEIGSSQRQILKENPKVTFEYVGMIQDSRLEDPKNPDGGLTLYTRNGSGKYWTDSNDNYMVGTISEVTDTRTGKVYEATTRAIEYDIDTLWRGALGVSQFMDLMDPSAIPYLKATKITYEVQEVVEEAEWKVNFEVADTTTTKPIMTDLSFVEESESVTVKEIEYSVLGITIKATREVRDEDPLKLSIHDKMVLEIRMKNGSIIPLQCKVMSGTKEHYIASYILEDEHSDPAFVDVDQLEAIIINGEEVMVP